MRSKKPAQEKPSNDAEIAYKCGWMKCSEECGAIMEFNSHIENHIKNDMRMPRRQNPLLKCKWRECDYQTHCRPQLERHLYFHGYYAVLLFHGQAECKAKELPSCTLPRKTQSLYNFPELENDFICEWKDCRGLYASVIEFQDHIEQHARFEHEIQKSPGNERPKTQCKWTFCKKTMDNRYRLIEHVQTHSLKKVMACQECGEMFRTKTTFGDHLRRQPQNNTHNYQCAQCFKFFATQKLLRGHVVMHVNCFKCHLCDMTCSSVSSLTTHIRYRHMADKPFQCPECPRRWVSEWDLKRHILSVHKRQKHSCSEPGCSYVVASYNLLRRHFLEVHRSNPFIYVCHCCHQLFKHGKSLSAHLVRKHQFQLPSGHKRFTYKIDESGFYRLETMRIESLEVSKQIPNTFEGSSNTKDVKPIPSNELVGEITISLPPMDDFS